MEYYLEIKRNVIPLLEPMWINLKITVLSERSWTRQDDIIYMTFGKATIIEIREMDDWAEGTFWGDGNSLYLL